MGFLSNFLFRFLIFSSILIFVTKIYFDKVYLSQDYIDALKFFLNKIPLNKDLNSKIEFCVQNHLEKLILFTGLSTILSIFGMKLFSFITCLLYGILAITNYLITKEIFSFDFYHLSQEFLLLIAPLILIPLIEINLIFDSSKNVKKSVIHHNKTD